MTSLGYAHVVRAIYSQVGRQDDDVRGVFTAIHATLICFPTHAVYALGYVGRAACEERRGRDVEESNRDSKVELLWCRVD